MAYTFTESELCTILAALRALLRHVRDGEGSPGWEDATNDGTSAPLADDEIEALIARLDFADHRQYVAQLPLLDALWWFIENLPTERTSSNAIFFDLRERVRQRDQVPSLNIPENAWRDLSVHGDCSPRTFLVAEIRINGVNMHLEAIQVETDDGRVQRAVDFFAESALDKYREGADADGPFQTVMIEGREYALIASPFC